MRRQWTVRESLVLLAVLVAASTLAVLARRSTSAEPTSVTRVTDDQVIVGVVADLTGHSGTSDELLVRGLRLWDGRVAERGGLTYQTGGRKAALTLSVADSRGSTRGARTAAAGLLRRGAHVLIGPSSASGTAAAAAEAREHGALFLGAERRPPTVPADSLSRFLTPPRLGDFTGALDAFNASRPAPRRPASIKAAVIATIGGWGVRARRTMALVRARGYTARLFRIQARENVVELQRAVGAFEPDIVLLSTPYETAIALAGSSQFADAQLVAVPARDIEQLAVRPTRKLVVALPWTPSERQGGVMFPPGELNSVYKDAYGSSLRRDVAAGASLGELLSASILLAQSTDMSRVVRAIDRVATGSPAGVLQFKDGEQVQPTSAAVVARPRGPLTHLWPGPPASGWLQGHLPAPTTNRQTP